MSIELEDAKTKVAQFQKQCDEYLVIIVQQKREADEQQKVGRSFRSVKYACTVKPVYHTEREILYQIRKNVGLHSEKRENGQIGMKIS